MGRGKIIAIEGVESSGKTTHVQSLKEYLEEEGYGVVTFGIQSSKLMAEAIAKVKKDIVFQRRTLFLAYVTDLADQVENVVKPALESGFIAIADGYLLTLEAWGITRKLEKEWIEGVLSALPKADISVSLVSPSMEVMRRIIRKKGFLDPLSESVDLCINEEIFTSYRKYVIEFQKHLKGLSREVIVTRGNVREVDERIKSLVKGVLGT